MIKKDWSNYVFIALLPFLCVLMIYAIEGFTRYSFFECKNGNCGESIPANIWKVFNADPHAGSTTAGAVETEAERQVTALRYSGRINWFFASEIFFYVCAICLAIALVLSFQISPHPRIAWALGVLILSSLLGFVFQANPGLHMAIFLALFKNAITSDVPTIGQLVNTLNSFGNAALLSLLLTICITLIPSQNDSASPAGLRGLAAKIKHLSIILYAGTFLLVTAILVKDSIYQWSLAYTVQDKTIEIAKKFASNLLTWEGGFYTLVLAAAYLPAMLVLQRRARLMLDPSLSELEKETKLKEIGMNFSVKESLPRILAILGPFLTGPVGQFLTGKFFQ